MEKEVRFLTESNLEVRELGEEKEIHLQGYAITFDSLSENMGGFKEIIKRSALDNCDLSNVVLCYNHDISKIMARNTKIEGIGSLTLKVDEKGLFFDAIPTDTTYFRDLLENMKAGIVGKCSFAFTIDESDPNSQLWEWDNGSKGYSLRTILKIFKIYELSIVISPAYKNTSATAYQRALDKATKEFENEKELELIKLELELM